MRNGAHLRQYENYSMRCCMFGGEVDVAAGGSWMCDLGYMRDPSIVVRLSVAVGNCLEGLST